MYELVKNNIIDNNLIAQGENVLIGLSGGPDSVFLFYNLRMMRDLINFNLYASHINHMYREEEAQRDEDFVRNLCEEYNIKLFVKRKNTKELLKELKTTEEEAGRILRYGFFKENLDSLGGGKIAVAHNLNDQAETVLQRIIRGSGIDGLSAMKFQTGNIIRPILNVERKEIEKYLNDNDFKYCIDNTNNEDIYGRNKIRLNLIPYLEANYNPNIQKTLTRMAQTMAMDKILIDKYIDIKYNEVLENKSDNYISFYLHKLKELSTSEKSRIIRRAIEELKGYLANLEKKHVDIVVDFIETGKTGKRINLTENFTVEISYDSLIVNKIVEHIDNFEYDLSFETKTTIKEVNKTLSCKLIDCETYEKLKAQKDPKNNIYIDFENVKGKLSVRNRRNGDTYVPLAMTSKKKIKDILIDLKVPLSLRNKMLIITDDENIIWLEGYRINDNYKVSITTKKFLYITKEEQNE